MEDPYRPPEASLAPPRQPTSGLFDEQLISEEVDRNYHLPVEATIRTIGLMMMLLPAISLINVGVASFSPRFAEILEKQAAVSKVDPSTLRIFMYAGTILGGFIVLLLGLGLRSLKNWARWIFIVFGIFGLFGTIRTLSSPLAGTMSPLSMLSMVLGAAISLSQIFLLFLPGASHVCSRHYQFVISTTPEIRPNLGFRDKLLLGALAVNGILGLLAVFV